MEFVLAATTLMCVVASTLVESKCVLFVGLYIFSQFQMNNVAYLIYENMLLFSDRSAYHLFNC